MSKHTDRALVKVRKTIKSMMHTHNQAALNVKELHEKQEQVGSCVEGLLQIF